MESALPRDRSCRSFPSWWTWSGPASRSTRDYLDELSAEITARIEQLERRSTSIAGRPVQHQLDQAARDRCSSRSWGCRPGGGRRPASRSTPTCWRAIRDRHPIVDLILEYRTLAKLKSTYVDALPLRSIPATGRVHTSFNQTVAATGRLSSTNPNLQNIPIRTELGRRVRRAFVADHRPEYRLFDDSVLVAADYSQIELRLLAHMSGEPFLVEAFRSGEDIHRRDGLHGLRRRADEVTPDMRRVAKTVNFGIIYGMQAYGLSRDTGLSRADATNSSTSTGRVCPRSKRSSTTPWPSARPRLRGVAQRPAALSSRT